MFPGSTAKSHCGDEDVAEFIDTERIEIGVGEVEFKPALESHDLTFNFRFAHGIDGVIFILRHVGTHFPALPDTLVKQSRIIKFGNKKCPRFCLFVRVF